MLAPACRSFAEADLSDRPQRGSSPWERSGAGFSMLRELWVNTLDHDWPKIERIGDGVVYARLPTFDSSHYEGVSREGWAQREPGDHVLIVDLRNNGGGEVSYGLDVLKGGWTRAEWFASTASARRSLRPACTLR